MFFVRSMDEIKSVIVIRFSYVVKFGVAFRYRVFVDFVEKLEIYKLICLDEYIL